MLFAYEGPVVWIAWQAAVRGTLLTYPQTVFAFALFKFLQFLLEIMAAIPAGQTWFDTLKRSFADVPVDEANDNAISTAEFLEAAEALVTLFGMCAVALTCRV